MTSNPGSTSGAGFRGWFRAAQSSSVYSVALNNKILSDVFPSFVEPCDLMVCTPVKVVALSLGAPVPLTRPGGVFDIVRLVCFITKNMLSSLKVKKKEKERYL